MERAVLDNGKITVYNVIVRFFGKAGLMDEKKRQKMMRVFRVIALILALLMIAGVIINALG